MNQKTQTATATQPKQEQTIAQTADNRGKEVAVLTQPRLPYPGANLLDTFGVRPGDWKVLVEAIFPNAKTPDAVMMALAYCRQRNLDIFKRPIHIVPMWDSSRKAMVETCWPGISELRTTAQRTGNYAGCDEAEFGPTITRTFRGKMKVGRDEWKNEEVTIEFPEWCRMTVYRMLSNGTRCKFVGPKTVWLESYATIGKSDLPNEMWKDRREGQIEKCAEAGALRRAFPEELGNEYIAEEMAGRVIHDDGGETVERTQTSAGPPPPSAVKGGNAAPAEPAQAARQEDIVDVEHEEVDALPADDENPAPQSSNAAPPTTGTGAQQPTMITMDERDWLNELSGAFSGCEDLQTFTDTQKKMMANQRNKVSKEAWARAQHLAEDAYKRVSANG